MQCPTCGEPAEGRFCAQCGTELTARPGSGDEDRFWQDTPPAPAWSGPPPPAPRRRLWPIVAAVVAALLVGGGAALWVLTTPDGRVESDRTSSDQTSADSDDTSDGGETDGGPSDSPETTTTTTTTKEDDENSSPSSTETASPEEQLSDIRSDSIDAVRMGEQWAVTLSAKYDGISDSKQTTESGSHTFREEDILTLHEQLENQHESDGAVYLLTSKDIASTADSDYPDTLWMTVLDPGGLSSRDAAVRWCKREFPELSGDSLENRCYPRKLESP